jgi:hypothetical protein
VVVPQNHNLVLVINNTAASNVGVGDPFHLLVEGFIEGWEFAVEGLLHHGAFYELADVNELPLGQFHHLAGTWNGATLRLFVDGVLDAEAAPGATPVSAIRGSAAVAAGTGAMGGDDGFASAPRVATLATAGRSASRPRHALSTIAPASAKHIHFIWGFTAAGLRHWHLALPPKI